MSTTYVKVSCEGCGTQTHTILSKTLESYNIGEAPHTVYETIVPDNWSVTQEGQYNCPDCTSYLRSFEPK